MAVIVKTGSAVSTAANTRSADQVTGSYMYIGKGRITLIAKASATGLNITFSVGGIPLMNDEVVPYTGTAGTISVNDNVVLSQVVNGGKVELYLRNTTGGAITCDYQVLFEPLGR